MRQPYERRGLSEKQSSKNYRKRQEKMARAKSKARRGRSLTTTKQEHKYQMIKLMHSGRSLRETKAMMKSLAVASTREYMSDKDLTDILALEGGINSINRTRNDAQQLMKIKFKPRTRIGATRAERAAQFIMGETVGAKFDWERDGNLIRQGRPNPSIDGSSRGKIGLTTVRGADRVLRDFKALIKSLLKLQRSGKKRSSGQDIQKLSRGLRASTSVRIRERY
jgi:hypothetical protein